jgi:hypothetical protein
MTRGITGAITVLIAGVITVPAAYAAPASATHPAAAAAKARTVDTFKGSGDERTRRFWVTSTWKLSYQFSCKSFGDAGNFIVWEDGGSDFNGVEVNDLAMSKTASTWAYDDAGRHYLQIISECSWTLKIIDEP